MIGFRSLAELPAPAPAPGGGANSAEEEARHALVKVRSVRVLFPLGHYVCNPECSFLRSCNAGAWWTCKASLLAWLVLCRPGDRLTAACAALDVHASGLDWIRNQSASSKGKPGYCILHALRAVFPSTLH